jgi:PAS domain S-box-containing protein
MSLRIKILLPPAIFGFFLFAYLYGYWMPLSRSNTEAEYRQSIERHLETVAEGVTPLLLGRQLDAVYEFLDVLKRINEDWISIAYIDAEGRSVYPLTPPGAPEKVRAGQHVHAVRRQIRYLGRDLGTIILNVDFAPRLNEMNERYRQLMVTLLAVLLVYVASAWLVVEWVIRRPVNRLAHASRKLADGVFDAPLPKRQKDEVGVLVNSFAAMRNAIRAFQSELVRNSSVLRKSEQRLAEAQRLAHVGSWELDLTTNTLTWSDEIYRIFGIEPRAFGATYEAFLETIHLEDRDGVNAAYTGSVRDNSPYDIVHRIVRKVDGTVRIVHEKAEHVRDASGAVVRSLGTVQDITELRLAEEALRRSERKLTLHLQQTALGVIEWDREFRATEWNPAAEAIFGYGRGEALGRSAVELILPPEIVDEINAVWNNLLRQTGGTHNVNENVTRDGRRILCEWFNTPLADGTGRVMGVMSLVQDITERSRSEDTARLLSAIVENSDDAIIGKTLDGIITNWNRGAEAVYGYRSDEVIGKPITVLVPVERKFEESRILERLRRGEHIAHFETIRKRKDGTLINLSQTTSPIKDSEGRIIGVSTIARDITERKRAEEELNRAGAYNRSLIEASLDPLVTIDAGGRITDVNAATEKVTGFPREKLLGTDFSDYFTEPEKARDGYRQVFREGTVRDYALELRCRDGQVTPVLYNASVYRDETGAAVGVFAAARDITERKRAEEELKRAGVYNRSLIEASLDPLVTIDADGKITDVNAATEKVTGFSREELSGTDFSDYFTEPEKARAGYRQVFREGTVRDYALELRRRDGQVTPVLYNASVYRDETGAVVGVFAAARDITERKRAEEEIRKLNEELEKRVRERTDDLQKKSSELEESQRALMNIVEDLNLKTEELAKAAAKLKDLDRLKSMFIASMSHELRTPLNSVIGFSSILLSEWLGPVNAEQKENLATILRSGKHLLNLINDVIDVSKIEAGKVDSRPEEFDLHDLVSEAAGLVRVSARDKGLTLSLDLRHQPMRTDRRRLLQCLLNLLSNALKFTDKGGITVRAGVSGAAPELVELSVEDTGIGVREEDLAKLFQPFVRLAPPGQTAAAGTGLGLYLTEKLVREILKGDILCTSTFGKGTKFTVRIPARIM